MTARVSVWPNKFINSRLDLNPFPNPYRNRNCNPTLLDFEQVAAGLGQGLAVSLAVAAGDSDIEILDVLQADVDHYDHDQEVLGWMEWMDGLMDGFVGGS